MSEEGDAEQDRPRRGEDGDEMPDQPQYARDKGLQDNEEGFQSAEVGPYVDGKWELTDDDAMTVDDYVLNHFDHFFDQSPGIDNGWSLRKLLPLDTIEVGP